MQCDLQVRGELLDWTQQYTGPKFDVVLACDVLYEVRIILFSENLLIME
jgi:hypothetical protein